jgi:phosphoribosyl 1,2-cyclic phosphodiesterase
MPCPGPDTVLFGGNTACLEIRAGDRLIIIDSGTGIRLLGDKLISGDYIKGPVDADIFITHTHWDHIMGFPMFVPLFIPQSRLRIRGPVSSEEDTLESIIGTQLSYKFWPVRQSELAANIEYDQIKETTLDLEGGVKVITKYLNHPILCMGYRIEYHDKVIVTAYDHEPYRNIFPTDPKDPGYDEDAALEGETVAKEENEKILKFFKDADILIHDTQYTEAEMEKHRGWGHSSYELAIDAAVRAGVKKLIFFHHDPGRTDWQLENLENNYQSLIADKGLEVLMAREGLTLNV